MPVNPRNLPAINKAGVTFLRIRREFDFPDAIPVTPVLVDLCCAHLHPLSPAFPAAGSLLLIAAFFAMPHRLRLNLYRC